MLYEFCAENFERVPVAIKAGAGRIELCDNLAVGGTLVMAAGCANEECKRESVDITFHMAFDQLSPEAQLDAIDTLADCGVARILTHGGAAGTPIEDNFDHLTRLIEYAGDRLTILPGGGITTANRDAVAAKLGVSELHGTKIVPLEV